MTVKGTKTFFFQYRRGASVRRLILGRYGELTPDAARKLAEQARGEMSAGGDPVGKRASALAAEKAEAATRKRTREAVVLTLENLIERWQAVGLAGRSVSHRREGPAAIRRHLTPFLDQPAAGLTRADAQRVVDGLVSAHPVMARRTRDYARAMMNWGMKRQLITANPFAAVAVETKEVSRDRVLSDAELGAVWRAAGKLGYPFGRCTRLLILTLQRRQEVAAMRWSELDEDLAIWTIPAARAKNRKAHLVHLAEPARAILRKLRDRTPATPRARKGSKPIKGMPPLVFTLTGSTPISGFTRAGDQMRRHILEELAAIGSKPASADAGERWRLHDFRRTGVTALARLGVLTTVADRILNHVEGTIRGVAAVYQRHEFLVERKSATDLWAEHVLRAATVKAASPPARPKKKPLKQPPE